MERADMLAAGERMKVSRSTRTASRRIGGQTVVIDLERRVVYGLNASAGAIWEAMARPADATEVGHRFTPPPDQPGVVRQAVQAFLDTLSSLGLVRPTADDAPAPGGPAAEPTPFAAPEILWHEPLTAFAQSCAQFAGTGDPCDSSPVR